MKNNKNLVLIITNIVLVVFLSLSFLIYDKSASVVVKGTSGSYAEIFANNNNLKFVALADSDNPNVDIPVKDDTTEPSTENATDTETVPVVKDNGTFAYNYVNDKTVTIVDYKGYDSYVIIPDTIDTLPVTKVAFDPIASGVKMVQFSDNVTAIEGKYSTARYTAEFFVALVLMLLGYAYAILATFMAFNKADTNEKTFYGIPLVYNGFATLIVVAIASALSMILNLPIVVMAIITIIILAVSAMGLVKTNAARDAVEVTGAKVKQQTAFIRLLTADAEHLMSTAATPEIKANAKKVYEAIRYSDPMSSDALSEIEERIAYEFKIYEAAIKSGDSVAMENQTQELLLLLDNRNKKCKVLK